MPLHLSTDGVVTKCGLPVGELVLDGCTGDPDLFDAPSVRTTWAGRMRPQSPPKVTAGDMTREKIKPTSSCRCTGRGNILPVAAVDRAWPFGTWRKSCCTNGPMLSPLIRPPRTRT